MKEQGEFFASADLHEGKRPLPDPPPQAGEGKERQAAEAEQPSLTARARALYEDSVVTVAQIARLCGVTERTIYKYAHRQNWKPRYRWEAGKADANSPAGRHRRWQPTEKFAPAKGAGARFIAREDAGKPFPVGLKATDPAAAARAAAQCSRAQALADAAQARVRDARDGEAVIDAIAAVGAALAEINGWRRALQKKDEQRVRRAKPATRQSRRADGLVWRDGMLFAPRPRAPHQVVEEDLPEQGGGVRSRRTAAVEHALWVAVEIALARWEAHLPPR